jgi:hypothetical protein
MRVQLNALLDFVEGRKPLKDPLSSPVVSLIEACQQDLKISMLCDIDTEDFACDPAFAAFSASYTARKTKREQRSIAT